MFKKLRRKLTETTEYSETFKMAIDKNSGLIVEAIKKKIDQIPMPEEVKEAIRTPIEKSEEVPIEKSEEVPIEKSKEVSEIRIEIPPKVKEWFTSEVSSRLFAKIIYTALPAPIQWIIPEDKIYNLIKTGRDEYIEVLFALLHAANH